MTDPKKLRKLLNDNVALLDKAMAVLMQSYAVCEPVETPIGFEQLESAEAFTARFARAVDIYTQKVLVGIVGVVGEDLATFIDRAYFAEKLGVIPSADLLFDMRRVRNDIAHDYTEDEFLEVFAACKQYTPSLAQIVTDTKRYITEKIA